MSRRSISVAIKRQQQKIRLMYLDVLYGDTVTWYVQKGYTGETITVLTKNCHLYRYRSLAGWADAGWLSGRCYLKHMFAKCQLWFDQSNSVARVRFQFAPLSLLLVHPLLQMPYRDLWMPGEDVGLQTRCLDAPTRPTHSCLIQAGNKPMLAGTLI